MRIPKPRGARDVLKIATRKNAWIGGISVKPLKLRDIIGPIMVGPSSSHTAGALRIASMVRDLLQCNPVKADFTLYGSFAQTGRGHGMDKALVAGMLGMHTDDLRIRNSFEAAREVGLEFSFKKDHAAKTPHPNTVDITAVGSNGSSVQARGVSIGGGAAKLTRIDGMDVEVTGEFDAMVVRQTDTAGNLAHVAGCLSAEGINIGSVFMHRKRKGGDSFTVFEVDEPIPQPVIDHILERPTVASIRLIPADGLNRQQRTNRPQKDADEAMAAFEALDFATAARALDYCERNGIPLSEWVARRERALAVALDTDPEETEAYLNRVLDVMRASAVPPYRTEERSMGGLIGGEAAAMQAFAGTEFAAEHHACDRELSLAATYSAAVLETNASMGLIVAAPTAGSSGVIPSVLLSLQKTRGLDDKRLKAALLNAAAVGLFITRNATVSGAEGGCQAEIGAASAMAASAAVELLGGDARMCLRAAGTAISNSLGLVCDPVGGLVEVPCQKRNAMGAANALVSAEFALAGIPNLVPFDETVDALLRVGRSLPRELRETALGGLATCPSACNLRG